MAIAKGAAVESQLRLLGLKPRKNNELETTETELKAMAKPASSGFKTMPSPTKTRVAMGMPKTL